MLILVTLWQLIFFLINEKGWQKIQLVKFTQCAVIQWLEDVMCVFTFPTQKMLSEAKIENVPFVSIKQTVGDE